MGGRESNRFLNGQRAEHQPGLRRAPFFIRWRADEKGAGRRLSAAYCGRARLWTIIRGLDCPRTGARETVPLSAVPHSRSPLDTRIEIVTPENIAFQYRVAGPFARLPAYLIDLLFRLIMVVAVGLVAVLGLGVAGLPGMGFGLMAVVAFITEWFYCGLFEALWNGQTPGKRLLHLRVLTAEGQPINAWQAVLRNFLRGVDALPWMCYQFGLFSAASNDRFQRLGDLAAGTMVVVEQRASRADVVRIEEAEALALAAQLPPGLVISRSLARALSAYVIRRPTFAWRRRIEIALHLSEPLRLSLGLPRETHPDHLLCALYHHAFIADRLAQPRPIGRDPQADARQTLLIP